MKISKTRLKQIIKEELDDLSETGKGIYPDETYWIFIPNPPDQSSSDDDWYALSKGGVY